VLVAQERAAGAAAAEAGRAEADEARGGADPAAAQGDRARAALADLKQLQIKTLSFLAFLMRQAHAIVRGHQARAPPPPQARLHAARLPAAAPSGLASLWGRPADAARARARQDGVVAALVRVLQSCPDIVAWRKEVLVATRHVMNVMLRTGTPAAVRRGCRDRSRQRWGRRGARA
jgi:hypothetical protein